MNKAACKRSVLAVLRCHTDLRCRYCIALNTHLTDPQKPYLELLEPALAAQLSETSAAAMEAKANL